MSNIEQTLSIIKPDAVERNLIEEIKNIFLSNNFNISNIIINFRTTSNNLFKYNIHIRNIC